MHVCTVYNDAAGLGTMFTSRRKRDIIIMSRRGDCDLWVPGQGGVQRSFTIFVRLNLF